jgi:acetolactate synthase-1/2/3 large subunit
MPDIGIVGDAKLVLRQLIDGIREKIKKRRYEDIPRVKEIIKMKREYEEEVESECRSGATPIPAKYIVRELNKVFGKGTILVNENGSQDCWSYCFPYYKVLDQLGCVPVAEQTCMGMGVVGAIAAKLTKPDMKVVCVTGDGAFQMYMKELPTAAQYNTGCTWVVLNNFSLGWVKYEQRLGAGWDTTTFKIQPDFVKVAEANKCYGERIEKPSEVRSALERALKANNENTPAVLDFIIEPLDMTHFKRAADP